MMVIFFNRIDGNSYGKGGPLKKVGSIFAFSKKVMALWKEEKLMLKVIWMEPDRVEAA